MFTSKLGAYPQCASPPPAADSKALNSMLSRRMSIDKMRRLDSLRRRKPCNAIHALVDCLQVSKGAVCLATSWLHGATSNGAHALPPMALT